MVVSWFLVTSPVHAAIFGIVSGSVQDPQQRAVQQAEVSLRADLSSWQEQTQTDGEGHFTFPAVPAGVYIVSVTKTGFQKSEQQIVVRSDVTNAVSVSLKVGAVAETDTVTAAQDTVNAKSMTTESLVTRDEIERRPARSGQTVWTSSRNSFLVPI
jgi:hypothetical protein